MYVPALAEPLGAVLVRLQSKPVIVVCLVLLSVLYVRGSERERDVERHGQIGADGKQNRQNSSITNGTMFVPHSQKLTSNLDQRVELFL